MSQRYIFLKMASFKELKDEGYRSYASMSEVPRLRRRSSASLPSNRSMRSKSLQHHRFSPFAKSPSGTGKLGFDSPSAQRLRLSTDSIDLAMYSDGHVCDGHAESVSLQNTDYDAGVPITIVEEYDEDRDDALLDDPTRCRLSKEVMFLVACLIVLVSSGGLILGFGPVYSTLVREDQWSELCDDKDPALTCAKQEVRLQYVFSTGFLCLSAANAFFGVFLDVAGPRLTALLGLSMSTAGNFALAFGDSHSGSGALIIVGYSLIGAGGMGSYLAAFQILQLFEVQGFVCSALSSLFNCSGYIYMLLQVESIARAEFFRVYGVIVMACMCMCFLLFPTNNIVRPRNTLSIPTVHIEAPRWVNPIGLMDGMREELKRPDLWYFAAFFGWISLIFGFAGGAIPSILASLAGVNVSAASVYTNILYPVLVNGTFIYSPIVGYVIDHYGFKVIFIVCLVLVQSCIALLLAPSLHVQILTFFVYAMAQACLYALQFAYIMMCFPPELYGSLQAFLATVSFLFGLFNYLLNPWTQMYFGGNYTFVLLLLGVPTSVLYFFIDVVRGCEDQTVKYDEQGNPIITIPLDSLNKFQDVIEPDESTKLL